MNETGLLSYLSLLELLLILMTEQAAVVRFPLKETLEESVIFWIFSISFGSLVEQ